MTLAARINTRAPHGGRSMSGPGASLAIPGERPRLPVFLPARGLCQCPLAGERCGEGGDKLLRPPGFTSLSSFRDAPSVRNCTRLRVHRAPGIPHALVVQKGEEFINASDASRRGIVNVSPCVIARSEATKQSSFLSWSRMDCFASLAMTVGRWIASRSLSSGAHSRDRWLAMTAFDAAAVVQRMDG
jgi:hypothetical protein